MSEFPEEDLTPDLLSNLRDLVRKDQEERTGQRIGHFVLQEQLGQGGMAVVYLAEQENLGRKVALKILKRVGDDRARSYFEREARMAASLDHPHIAKIFEVGEHEGNPYIAMQYVEGETFAGALLSMDMNRRVRAVLDMARALEYAHSRKVIHRDLKPENILVDRDGQVFITDFGLAKMESSGRSAATASSVVAGTPAYMAPEQARAKADAQSDLYSLGAILYQCMTGQPPFLGQNASEVLVKVLEQEPIPSRGLNAQVPEDLDAIIHHALQKKKEDRYATATELVEDLDAFLSGRPVTHARRPTFGYIVGKLFRRQPVILSLVAGLLLAIGIGSTVGLSLFSKAEEETELRERMESRRRLEERMNPLRKKIEETRFLFYIANVDIREKLDGVRESLEEVASIMEEPENVEFSLGWRTLGVGFYFIGDRTKAEEYLVRAGQLSPGDSVTEFYLGRIYLDRSFQWAVGILAEADEDHEEQSRFWANRALSHLGRERVSGKDLESTIIRAYLTWLQKDLPSLIQICDRAIETFGKELGLEEFWNLKGIVAQGREQEEEYSHAISHRPHYAWGYYMRANNLCRQGRSEEAVRDYNRAIRINPRLPDAYNGRGIAHLHLGLLKKALEDFTLAIELAPGNATWWNNRGSVLYRMGEIGKALQNYRKAVEINPEYSDAHYNWGNTCLFRKEYKMAIEKYTRAISINNKRAGYFHNRAVARRHLGKIHEAIADYGKTVELDPRHSVAYFGRAELWVMLKESRKAFDDLTRAIFLDSRYAMAFYERARVCWNSGDVSGAIRDYTQAIELQPENDSAYLNRGVAWMRKGDFGKAVEDYSRAIDLKPGRGILWYNRARAHRKLGDPESAIRDYTEATRLNPDHAEAWANRADIYRNLDRRAEAIRDYQKALEVAPEKWSYRSKVQSLLDELRKKI